MSNFKTIQKLSDETGISQSSINMMLKKNILTKYESTGIQRVLINVIEFDASIKKVNNHDLDSSINLDNFLIS